ncbi:phage DNA packaging protein [Candidatus Termititenax aidoneus]|uniref:Phage DNA packaging protein n=1 Tax=Termititenax aidoneus TaxID=2218524 RepID=A0A388TAJ1_TERA1|nr:phage DNA packaging protein [Candidatus Termititenax aidoneus]
MRKTPKQAELLKMIASYRCVLAEGGSRSGKTLCLVDHINKRALNFLQTDHLIVRLRLTDIKASILAQTYQQLSKLDDTNYSLPLNKSELIFTFENGSRVWLAGADDPARVDKILGREYATIFFNEVSQIAYSTFETILTRLNPPKGIRPQILLDQNPDNINHWTHKIFHERKFPDGRPVPDNDYKVIHMNPADNPHLSEDYIQMLEGFSEQKRKRFLFGEYQQDIGSLWRRAWITYEAAPPPYELRRIAIGVDPSGSKTGDAVGIIVAARASNNKFYVLADYTLNGTPQEWAMEVRAAYDKYKADIIVAERNFGGDMVENTIKGVNKSINVRLVTSSRGKIVRAEPISAMYERGEVKHAQEFVELENELCGYTGADNEASPNRMDALVFALTELASKGGGMEDNARAELQNAFELSRVL